MGLLPDSKNAGCAYAKNAGNVFQATDFKGDRQLATPVCITVRASIGIASLRWWENVPGIAGACATHNFTYLARGPLGMMRIISIKLVLS